MQNLFLISDNQLLKVSWQAESKQQDGAF